MRHFGVLLRHELRALFIAPSTYIASVLFLLLMAYVYYMILESYIGAEHDVSVAETFFKIFWLPVFFMVPLLTMRSVAEDRRAGTLETLMTTPVTSLEVICSKFLAAWLFYVTLWGITLAFPFLVIYGMGRPGLTESLLDPGILIGGYGFVALSGLLFVAVGIFASSLTRNQLVAGMLSFSILFILIVGMPALEEHATAWELWLAEPLEFLKVFRHLEDFSRGMIDTRPIFYYLSNAGLVLGLAVLLIDSKA